MSLDDKDVSTRPDDDTRPGRTGQVRVRQPTQAQSNPGASRFLFSNFRSRPL